ncbi:MAG: hypothetical protein ACLPWG_08950 [Steroidobacteraceae bacterium]
MTIIRANGASYDFKERVVPDYHSRCAWKSENGSSGTVFVKSGSGLAIYVEPDQVTTR